ncbi:MAG: hypothetical protein ABR888_04665 [Thermoplasmata archaeon]
MTQIKTRLVATGLMNKGFREADGDHRRLIFYFEGRKTEVRTKVSHGSREISDGLIHAMAQQTKLSKGDFIDLVTCTLSEDGYAEKLRASGVNLDPVTG